MQTVSFKINLQKSKAKKLTEFLEEIDFVEIDAKKITYVKAN